MKWFHLFLRGHFILVLRSFLGWEAQIELLFHLVLVQTCSFSKIHTSHFIV